MVEQLEPSSPRVRTGAPGFPGSAMAAPRQNASPPSLSPMAASCRKLQPWPPHVVPPLPEVPPLSRRTGVATPESGTIAGLDHVNHVDEDGSCSISYCPLPTVTLDAATCDIDLPPRHVTEGQEYDTTTMTGERDREDDVIAGDPGAVGEETPQVRSFVYSTLSCQKLDEELNKMFFL